MKDDAVGAANIALHKYRDIDDCCFCIRGQMENVYDGNWACVMGKSFATSADYEPTCYMEMEMNGTRIVIYKSSRK